MFVGEANEAIAGSTVTQADPVVVRLTNKWEWRATHSLDGLA
jgi:hypothetical protein